MSNSDGAQQELSLARMQSLIQGMYGDKDEARGIPGTFMWLMEEITKLVNSKFMERFMRIGILGMLICLVLIYQALIYRARLL